MPAENTVQQLRLAHFLRGLDEQSLRRMAEELQLATFERGERLLQLGQPVRHLFILLSGQVDLLAPSEEGLRRVGQLGPGSVVGAWELLDGNPAQQAAEAAEPVQALLWPRTQLFEFLERQPGALASLRLAANSRRLANAVQFEWLSEDETVYALARKHAYRLAVSLVIPALFLLAGAALSWRGLGSSWALLRWAGPLLFAGGALYAVWKWIDWRNDYYLVTDKRVAWLEKVVAIYDSRREAPLHQILSVSVSTNMMGRFFDFGDVNIRTYTGNIVFKDVGQPQAIAAVVEERWRRMQLARRVQDRDLKEAAVQDLLEGRDEPEPPLTDLPEADDRETSTAAIGLDHWTLQLRFEQQGVITYRKHWAVLVQAITLPSIFILFTVALIGAALSGMIALGSGPVFITAALAVLTGSGVWWVYRYVDWANDIYQVSKSHVIDVYKRPLGRELRRVAPLENLLSTEVDQRGLIGILLNFGDVRVNVGTEELDFEGVFNPHEVQQDIVRAQEAFLERKRQREREQRKNEMVEWLSIYHDELQSRREKPTKPKKPDDYP